MTLPASPTAPLIQLPTQDHLPCDDGVPMETQRHKLQMDMLLDALLPWLAARNDGYVGGNMFIYFSAAQVRNQDFKGPDFFAVLGVPKRERKSWVVWEEDHAPNVIIELLSESTATHDKTGKKQIYQDQLRVPEYFWYDPFNSDDWAGFALQNGIYQPLALDQNNRLISQQLNLALVRWQGLYKGVEAIWLRWETLNGELMLLPEELAQQAEQKANQAEQKANQAEQKANQAEQKANQAEQRAEQLAARLRAMGIDPEEI